MWTIRMVKNGLALDRPLKRPVFGQFIQIDAINVFFENHSTISIIRVYDDSK